MERARLGLLQSRSRAPCITDTASAGGSPQTMGPSTASGAATAPPARFEHSASLTTAASARSVVSGETRHAGRFVKQPLLVFDDKMSIDEPVAQWVHPYLSAVTAPGPRVPARAARRVAAAGSRSQSIALPRRVLTEPAGPPSPGSSGWCTRWGVWSRRT